MISSIRATSLVSGETLLDNNTSHPDLRFISFVL